MLVELTRIRKNGRALYIVFTVPMQEHTGWQKGDRLAVRPAGDKLIVERIRLEDLAKLRTSEVPYGDSQPPTSQP
jgi:hypothetical protein